ncbi:hypothetical protein TNCV_2618011 [Trichonephila clavipes]|nr:hypothetical protein TNCV_2618011 [Trichonephila clavipes]
MGFCTTEFEFITAESVPEPDENVNLIEEVINIYRQINLEMNSDDVQELLDSHSLELVMDELIETHEQKQDIEELEPLDSVQSEDRKAVDRKPRF